MIYFKKIDDEIISNSLHARRMLLFDLVNFFSSKEKRFFVQDFHVIHLKVRVATTSAL